MNAITSIAVPAVEHAGRCEWEEVERDAATWRGRCIEAFARIEHAVVETMRCPQFAGNEKPEHMPSHRLDQVLAILTKDKRFVSCEHVRETLESVRALIDWRNLLCHGTIQMLRGRGGEWHLRIAMTDFRKGVPQSIVRCVELAETDVLAQQLGEVAGRTAKRLKRVRELAAS